MGAPTIIHRCDRCHEPATVIDEGVPLCSRHARERAEADDAYLDGIVAQERLRGA